MQATLLYSRRLEGSGAFTARLLNSFYVKSRRFRRDISQDETDVGNGMINVNPQEIRLGDSVKKIKVFEKIMHFKFV